MRRGWRDSARDFLRWRNSIGVDLVGGDTTRGPLNLCVTIIGEVPALQALRRSGAQIGDDIWVSGTLGDAALALAHLQGSIVLAEADFTACASRLHQPQPRVALGMALRGIATSAIDISDGLLADLGHILESSQSGAHVDFMSLPISPSLRRYFSQPLGMQCVLAGGDDYELCCTVPAPRRAEVERLSSRLGLPLTRIGEIVAGRECSRARCVRQSDQTGEQRL